jgi:hypothetical protein
MMELPDELKAEIAEYGTPLPFVEPDDGEAYVVLSVKFSRTYDNGFRAVAQGVNAVGDGDEPSDALFALCAAIEMLAKNFG